MAKNKSLLVGLLLILTSCSSYKSSWDCPKEMGIGCSSLEYADEVAKDQIILNYQKSSSKTVLINEDLLGIPYIKEVEIKG